MFDLIDSSYTKSCILSFWTAYKVTSILQWFTMKRQHALIVLADNLYYAKFKLHCQVMFLLFNILVHFMDATADYL